MGLTIYETGPMDGMTVLNALRLLDHTVPFPFRPTVYGALVPGEKEEPVEMRLYLADSAAHVTTWYVCRELSAKNITPVSDLVDCSIYLDRAALASWAVKMASAPVAANH